MSGNNTKQKIYDVSLKLFAENGYHGTSIRNITSAVGIKESSFYNHFDKKESLLNFILEKFEETFLESDDELDSKIDLLISKYDPNKIIYLSLRQYFIKLHDQQNRFLWQIVLNEQFRKDKAAQNILDMNAKFQSIAALLFFKLQGVGAIESKFDVNQLAFIFSNAVRSLFFEYILKYDDNTEIDELQILTEFFMRMF